MARNRAGTQPVRVPTGGDYGARRQLESQQKAAPIAAVPTVPGGGAPAPQPAPVERPNVFGPSQRENEPITAGAPVGAGPNGVGSLLPDDPLMRLRAIQMQYPSPGLARIIERYARQQRRGL